MCENCSENKQTITLADPLYSGTSLQVGSSSSEVGRVQTYLNALRRVAYPNLNALAVDGNFGQATRTTVMQYQLRKGLSTDGVVGRNTWNTLINDYNARIGGSANTWPGVALRNGSRSQDVTHMQRLLNDCARVYTAINTQAVDGVYGSNMTSAVRLFQRQFGLSNDGVLGQNTWNKIVSVHAALGQGTSTHVTTRYPGEPLRTGSTGDAVRCVQSYLNGVAGQTVLKVDGIYGSNTARAVALFQQSKGLTVDGIVGAVTWNALLAAFNATL